METYRPASEREEQSTSIPLDTDKVILQALVKETDGQRYLGKKYPEEEDC